MDNLKKSTTVQLLKEEILTILKKKSFYIMCLILIISIFSQTYLGLNRSITLENGFNSYEVISLFSIFIIMRLSKNKKRLKIQEGSKNIQYFFTEIISMYIVIVFVDMVFVVSKVLINLIQVGFGFINYKVLLLAIILNLRNIFKIQRK
ncbi:MAG: hypothetical protein ACRDDY_01810 [Clostridium sp.]|uniref:hypothetical protein n=1 Tax=Clostridium sp. TaxID=1506 RepID=UPI003EE7C3F0